MSAEAVRELRLRVVYDDQASGPARAFHQAERQRIRQTRDEQQKSDDAYVRAVYKNLRAVKQLADERVKGIKDAAAQQARSDEAYVRAIRSHLAAEKKLADEKAKGIRDAARAQATAAREANALLRGIASDEAKAAKDAETAKVRAAKATFKAWKADQDQRHRQAMQDFRDEQRAIRQAQRDQEKSDQAYIRAVMKKLAAEKQLEEEKRRSAEAGEAQTVGVLKMVAAFAGLQSVQGVISSMADHFDKIRGDAFQAAEEVMRMRGAVRELQALRDQMGKTGAGVVHIQKGAAETLQTPEEFQEMELSGLGVGELAIKNQRDREQFGKALIAAGKMQAIEGGNSGAYGQMVGNIALTEEGGLESGKIQGRLNRMYEIQRPGAFRTMGQAMGQYSMSIGNVLNKVYTPEEQMGLLTAFSTANPQEASTKLEQFTRAVMVGRIRARGMKVSDDVDAEKTSEYFKRLGITDQDTAVQRGRKIAEDLAKQEAGEQANGRRFNGHEYLATRGFGNTQDREALMLLSGLKQRNALANVEKAMNTPIDEGAIDRKFEEARKSDARLKRLESQAVGNLADTAGGFQQEPLVMAQEGAFNRLKAQGKIPAGMTFDQWRAKGKFAGAYEDLMFGPGGGFQPGGGFYSQVNAEAERAVVAESERLNREKGLHLETYLPGQFSEERLARRAREVTEAGGDVRGDVSGAMRSAAAKMESAAGKIDQAAGRLNAMPPLGMPNPRGR